MGLFSKKKCVLCGKEVGALNRTKLNNGNFLCSDCVAKTGICTGFKIDVLKNMSVDQINERIKFHNNDVNENQARIQKFTTTYKVGNYIWFDDNNKWFVLPKGTLNAKITNSYVFKYNELIDYEVLEDGTSVAKGGLGKALVGGAIFGVAGAIVGATSKKTKEICNKLGIRITTKNSDHPTLYLAILSEETNKRGILYETAQKNIQDIISKFQIITSDSRININSNVTTTGKETVADEIKKYKELLDVGAITQEEFDKKKKQLLNL